MQNVFSFISSVKLRYQLFANLTWLNNKQICQDSGKITAKPLEFKKNTAWNAFRRFGQRPIHTESQSGCLGLELKIKWKQKPDFLHYGFSGISLL